MKAIQLATDIVNRCEAARAILGDEEYEREVAESVPLLRTLMEQTGETNPFATVLKLIDNDKSLSPLAANMLICTAAEMVKPERQSAAPPEESDNG